MIEYNYLVKSNKKNVLKLADIIMTEKLIKFFINILQNITLKNISHDIKIYNKLQYIQYILLSSLVCERLCTCVMSTTTTYF